MKLRIDDIPEEGMDLEGYIDPAEVNLDMPGYRLNRRMEFVGHATKTEDDVYVKGTLRGVVEADCSRCLEVLHMPLEIELNVMYVPAQELPEREDGPAEGESTLAFYSGDTIDLVRDLRDLLLLNLPLKAVCKPDCKGLCASCGENLNVRRCACHDYPAGSPFDKLSELKKRMQGE